jgi:hypothetical protein
MGYAYRSIRDVQGSVYALYNLADKLESSKDLKALSDDCMLLWKNRSDKTLFITDEDKILLPSRILVLNPKSMTVNSEGVFLFFHSRWSQRLALTCREDGSLWLSGTASLKGTIPIYPDLLKVIWLQARSALTLPSVHIAS